MTPQDERELQDPASWEWESGEHHLGTPNAGAVVAVRFAGDEFDRVSMAAERAGLRTPQFIRETVLAHLRAQAPSGES